MSCPASNRPPGAAADVRAPGVSASQLRVLTSLKGAGAITVPVLAAELSLNIETIRHHLRSLERLGYVERRGTRKPGAGRPEVLFTLTDAGHRLFPDRQNELLAGLANHLEASGNGSLIDDFFDRWIDSRRPAAMERVKGLAGEARVREVAAIMSELGFMASAEVADGKARLHLCNCPMRDLVDASKAPCRAENALIRELLGERPSRLAYIPAGDATCSYELNAAG